MRLTDRTQSIISIAHVALGSLGLFSSFLFTVRAQRTVGTSSLRSAQQRQNYLRVCASQLVTTRPNRFSVFTSELGQRSS